MLKFNPAKAFLLTAGLLLPASAQSGPVVQPVIVPPEARFSIRHPSEPRPAYPEVFRSGTSLPAPTIGGQRGAVISARVAGYKPLEITLSDWSGKTINGTRL